MLRYPDLQLLLEEMMRTMQIGLINSRSLSVILVILVLAGCGKAPEPETEPPARPVKMMTIGAQDDTITWEFPGKVTAVRDVELAFEVQGKIIELPIEDGLEASKGDLLARLDPRDYEAARDAADAHRRAMRSAYVRAKNIFKEGAGSQAEVDKTERDITGGRAGPGEGAKGAGRYRFESTVFRCCRQQDRRGFSECAGKGAHPDFSGYLHPGNRCQCTRTGFRLT